MWLIEETNRNRRIYEFDELYREVYADRQQKELIPAGQLRAEAGHPMSKDLVRQQTIDPANTCAIFILVLHFSSTISAINLIKICVSFSKSRYI